ncbi:MAG: hypothetical protein RLZZ331_909 [Pseudomonadota bacterium]|jgi:hypothetical protein
MGNKNQTIVHSSCSHLMVVGTARHLLGCEIHLITMPPQ